MRERIAVIGMWHLGCSIAASWLRLGHPLVAIEFDLNVVKGLRAGHAPLFEPEVDNEIAIGLECVLQISSYAEQVAGCPFVFIAFDTPVADDDTPDLTPIRQAIELCGPHLDPDAVVIVSSQLPVGEARRLRTRLKELAPTSELVYSPENLRLGEAMQCYMRPGHIVVGSDSEKAANRVEALFAPMKAKIFRMNLPSAEMTKHCINSFLATSVTLANQWADIAAATGGDYGSIAAVLRTDPRIGERAYITPGVGFSGGTLGRDLRVLDATSRDLLEGAAPIFGQVWEYNSSRMEVVARRASALLGGLDGKRVALLGMTYKPGTSTLRRSLPLMIAKDLLNHGAIVVAHDPRADWNEITLPAGLVIVESPYDAVKDSDLTILLTEWPEYRQVDFGKLASAMKQPVIFDTKDFLRPCQDQLKAVGLYRIVLGQGDV